MMSNMAAIYEGNSVLFSSLQTRRGQQNTPPLYRKTSSRRAKGAPLVAFAGAASNNNHGQQEEGHLQVDQHRGKETQGKEVERSGQRRSGGGTLAGAAGRRRGDIPSLLLDTWDPFSVGGLSQMMDAVDQWFFGTAWPAAGVSAVRTPWDVVEDEEAFHVRVDVPGFGKEDVKVAVEDGEVLVIGGQRDSRHEEDQLWVDKSYSNFNTRLTLPDNAQDDHIKAELKNGVLCLTVPKCKPDETKQVIDVQVT